MSTTTYFLWRNKKNFNTFWLKKASYLELCSTFNIKTAPLIRLLLGSTKGGLNSRILLYVTTCKILLSGHYHRKECTNLDTCKPCETANHENILLYAIVWAQMHP